MAIKTLCELLKCPYFKEDKKEIQDFDASCYIYPYDVNVSIKGRCFLTVKTPMCNAMGFMLEIKDNDWNRKRWTQQINKSGNITRVPNWCPYAFHKISRLAFTFFTRKYNYRELIYNSVYFKERKK